ncbi:hypothetical protein [Methanosarcina sp.]|uniref:hypothetical protein n=1 Tax=Methanosarcina sp. TaxID=2213 RepID=UPI003BB652BA
MIYNIVALLLLLFLLALHFWISRHSFQRAEPGFLTVNTHSTVDATLPPSHEQFYAATYP